MSHSEMIPEAVRYLSLLEQKENVISAIPNTKIQHSIWSLGILLEQSVEAGLTEEKQRRMFKDGILSRISFYGVEMAQLFVNELEIPIAKDEIELGLEFHEFSSDIDAPPVFKITGKCVVCSWEHIGNLQVSPDDNIVLPKGRLIKACLNHHEEKRSSGQNAVSQHNLFTLLFKGGSLGHVAVSTSAVTGIFDLASYHQHIQNLKLMS